jgi:hypothetical protein
MRVLDPSERSGSFAEAMQMGRRAAAILSYLG